MTRVGTNSTMSHIRKRVISLKKGVQDMSHLPKALLLTILAWAVGNILGDPCFVPHLLAVFGVQPDLFLLLQQS